MGDHNQQDTLSLPKCHASNPEVTSLMGDFFVAQWCPNCRMILLKTSLMHVQVIMECGGMQQPLFIVTGSCLGQEIQLDMDHVPFGAVWQGSYSSRRILIINSGDIGARCIIHYTFICIRSLSVSFSFKWETNKFAPDFSISPTGGYLSPGMEVHVYIYIYIHVRAVVQCTYMYKSCTCMYCTSSMF